DLVELLRRRRIGLQPVCEPFVESGAVLAGHALVGGELDEHVPEAERSRAVADDHLSALEPVDVPVDERQRGLREERGYGIAAGIDADDRRAAEEVALTGAEAVEPHTEQALERGRDVPGGDLADRRKQL